MNIIFTDVFFFKDRKIEVIFLKLYVAEKLIV